MRLGAGGTHRRVSCVTVCVCVGATSCLTFFYGKFISFFSQCFGSFFCRVYQTSYICFVVKWQHTHTYCMCNLSDLMIAFEFVGSMYACSGFAFQLKKNVQTVPISFLFTFSLPAKICQFFDTMMHNVI